MTTDDIELSGERADVEQPQPDANDDPNGAADDVPELPDVRVRSALEFAVGIAIAGQKLRPPLAYPAGLKPFFKLNRLDRNSLRVARKAVAGDAQFRERLGLVATAELVDEIGLLWLKRPEGWRDDIMAAHERAKEAAVSESIETQLRRSERRREAAEQAAARVQAEMLSHHDTVAREQLRRERAEEMATTARVSADSAQREVARLRVQLDDMRSRADAATARAKDLEERVAALTDELRAMEVLRDDALANRVATTTPVITEAPPTAGNETAAKALRDAASATRDLAQALATASDALSVSSRSAAPVTPPKWGRDRNTKRRPIAIPGGVYGDSFAAAEYLVKVPGARVLVDGYNVAKLAWPGRELIDQRECAISLLEDFVRRTGVDLHVVFDGADVVGASAGRRIMRVQYSPAGIIADDVIRQVVASLPLTMPVVVVTNDQAIVTDMRTAGVNTISSDQFLAVVGFTSPGNRRQ